MPAVVCAACTLRRQLLTFSCDDRGEKAVVDLCGVCSRVLDG